ncbi:MAG: hypothetical protein U0872_06855 [Planctomycetaceae bacterium]
MTAVIPARFLFNWSWPVRRDPDLPRSGGQLLALGDRHRAVTAALGDAIDDFAVLRCGWNPAGFGVSVEVRSKQAAVQCHPQSPLTSDGFTVWIDTRHTQTVHRVTRFCHQFSVMPAGGGPKKLRPVVTRVSMNRADERPLVSAKGEDALGVWSEIYDDGYLLELWIPAEALTGFDPETSRQLGFYALVRDAELGEQYLTVGREFPFEHDPSLWQNLDLSDE